MITTQRAGDAWSQAGHMASKRVNHPMGLQMHSGEYTLSHMCNTWHTSWQIAVPSDNIWQARARSSRESLPAIPHNIILGCCFRVSLTQTTRVSALHCSHRFVCPKSLLSLYWHPAIWQTKLLTPQIYMNHTVYVYIYSMIHINLWS